MSNLSPALILDITDGKGNLVWDSPFRVLATMCHPDDSGERLRCLETLEALTLIEVSQTEVSQDVPRALLAQAADYARNAKAQIEKATDSAYGLTIAGDLLLLVVTAALRAPEHASLARAIRVLTEDQARGRTHGGRKVAASPRSVRDAWSRFKSVAHLCAAWRLYGDGGPGLEQLAPISNDTLPNFLAAAEIFRSLGEAHHAPSGCKGTKFYRESLLSPAETWKVPPDLILPELSLGVPPLTDFVQQSFRNYRAD
ncbi:MAG: hypothetical protein ABSD31_08415 [Candidatus Binataceae bacterium]